MIRYHDVSLLTTAGHTTVGKLLHERLRTVLTELDEGTRIAAR
jgi:hypothetical protein